MKILRPLAFGFINFRTAFFKVQQFVNFYNVPFPHKLISIQISGKEPDAVNFWMGESLAVTSSKF